MAGFRNIAEYVDAYENGQTFFTMVRKGIVSSASHSKIWFDWTMTGGYPTANFYASSPLVSAVLDSGIRIPLPQVSPAKQFLKSLALCVTHSSTSGTYGASMTHMLHDYLLYYPFFDMTAAGEVQEVSNIVSLPRYADGEGVRIMLISQSAVAGVAGLTANITYINQDGAEKTTPTFAVSAAAYAGVCLGALSATGANAPPFVPLAIGDTGVRSIVSAVFNADAGGIAAIVLVKPLFIAATTDPSTRLAIGPVSYGSFSKTEFIIEKQPVEVLDGAFLGFTSWFNADSRYTTLVAGIETIWN